MSTTYQTDAQRVAETDTETYYAPAGALTWRSNAERNKILIRWRLAVCIAFAEHPRCLRVALGALDHLFNTKTGFCNASNTYLAKLTGLPISKVQEALVANRTGKPLHGHIMLLLPLIPLSIEGLVYSVYDHNHYDHNHHDYL